MSDQIFKHDNLTITLIGRTDNGIDGSDEWQISASLTFNQEASQ